MASYRIPAIENFTFAKPEEWPQWIRRFERFRQASDLTSKSQEVQISTLVYSMGDKAEDILQSFALTGEDAKKYDTVKAKFEAYFVNDGTLSTNVLDSIAESKKTWKRWTNSLRTCIAWRRTASTEIYTMNSYAIGASKTANCRKSCNSIRILLSRRLLQK